MKKYILVLIAVLSSSVAFAQAVQSPSEFLGYEIGTQFTRHADVVAYFNHLSENHPMLRHQKYGTTHEGRTLSYAVLSSEKNLENLEQIRTDNLKQTGLLQGTAAPETAIVWLSYNVHGNEASCTEAAMQTAYRLLTEKQNWLENTVVIIDPNANPDGRDRYVNWYNQVKATPYNNAQEAAEHHEPWPSGRPNHYLFDLNRDWMWATQTETKQRLELYNKWLPHIHVDFHEQGINEPYYFAPAAEPMHEVITNWQREFQTDIGKNHANYFDEKGWLYFTRERFDLLYPSYGDTYPTFSGAIGMTYEQAGHGRAGLGIITDEGYELTLKDRITHHTTTGLSTVEMAAKNAQKLNREFREFFNEPVPHTNYVLQGNPDKIKTLTTLLDRHQISYGFADQGKVSGYNYATEKKGSMNYKDALVVSTKQPKAKMVQVLFEPETKLKTPITYDITAWNLPHAFGLEATATTTAIKTTTEKNQDAEHGDLKQGAVGYISKWNSIQDAAFLTELLQEDIKVRFTEKKMRMNETDFERGSLIITTGDNRKNKDFFKTLSRLAKKHERKLYSAPTGFSDSGTDFGSPDVKRITPPRVAVLKGDNTSSLSYGTLWHFFEQQLHYPITTMDTDYFKDSSLNHFDVLVLPSGYYQEFFDANMLEKVKSWIQDGGTLIAFESALQTFAGKEGFGLQTNTPDTLKKPEKDPLTPYKNREKESLKNMITGSIFKTSLDNSHPIAFGYPDTYFTLKTGSTSYKFLESGYNVAYLSGPVKTVSGYAGEDALQGLSNSLVLGEHKMGKGSAIYFVDDVLFRSFWENGKLFFVNSLFFCTNNVSVF